jgi:hypothetical protein
MVHISMASRRTTIQSLSLTTCSSFRVMNPHLLAGRMLQAVVRACRFS